MKNSFLSIVVLLFFGSTLSAQHLTISSTGETTSPGTNWSIIGNALYIGNSGSASINTSVITNHLQNTGDLTINLPWQSGVARHTYINNTIAYLGSNARTLTIQSANDIIFTNATGITSSTASLNVVLRSATGLSLGAPDNGLVKMDGINIDTKGGHFWVGGGTGNTTWNGLTVGNSYAVTWLDDLPGISIFGSSIATNGGNIYMNGQSWNSGDADGINYGINFENSVMSSGTGTIYFAGGVYGQYTNGTGMRVYGTTTTSITSTTGAIYIYGYGTDSATNGNAGRTATTIQGTASIKSESGAISVIGESNFASAVDKEGLMIVTGAAICSKTGNITLRGTNTMETSGQYSNSIRFDAANAVNSIRIGYDGTNAYSGNITIEGNSIYQRNTNAGAGSIAVQTTGTLTIQPTGTAFTYMRAANSDALTYDDDWNFGTNLGGFVYGKSTNTTALTYSNALTTNGPITMYAETLTQNGAVSSGGAITFNCTNFTLGDGTNISNSTASNITINANGNFTTSGTTRRTISSANGNITIHADKDADGSGTASIDYLTLSPGSGNIIIRFETVDWSFGSGQEPYLNGTGNITIEPSDAEFPYGISTTWFNFDQDNNGFSGLTLGKIGNTKNITHTGSAISVAGSVKMYGGTITANANLTSTATTGTGISLNGQKIIQNVGIAVTTSGANIDYLASGLSTTTGIDNAITIGADSGARASINAGGGNVSLTGSFGTTSTAGGADFGIWLFSTDVITSGTGSITLTGDATNTVSTLLAYGMSMGNATLKTASGAITLNGTGGKASVNSRGIVADGYSNKIISASGAITLNEIKPIGFTGTYTGFYMRPVSTVNTFIGADGTEVPSSSSSVTIKGDRAQFDVNGTFRNNINTSGAVVFESVANSFETAPPLTGLTISGNPSSVRVGKTTNTANITLGSAVTAAGPISVYGGNIFAEHNLTTTAIGAAILLQATGYIDVSASKTIQTNSGNITFRSNSSGTAVVLPNVTTGAITLNSGASLLSNGGNITLGGNFTGTQGAGLYAASNRTGGSPAVLINNATLTAAGGNINIYGKCTSSYDDGVRLQATITTTGSGTIGIYGDAWGGYNGTEFFGGISFFNEISRIETENGNVTLEGILTNSGSTKGFAIAFYRSPGLTGQTKHIQILSKTGDIQITADRGTSIGQGIGHSSWGHIYFGSPSNNSYTASGDIKFTYSNLDNAANNGFKAKTTGPITYEPVALNFDVAQSFPVNSNYVLADGASSLTIGKPSNTANITMSSAQTVAGPISIYGGTITINSNITSTLIGATVLMKATASIATAASVNVTTNKGDLIYWSDSDNTSGGAISLGDNNLINTTNGETTSGLSGGGEIILAGGLDNGANGGVAGDGIPDGVASNSTGVGMNLGTTTSNYTQMYSGGGDIIVRASTSNASASVTGIGLYQWGRWLANSGKGAINITGNAVSYYGINFTQPASNVTTGSHHLQLISDKVSGSAITINGTSTNSHGVVFNYNNPKEIVASGGGSISINGEGGSSLAGIFLQNQDILASTGDINLNAGANGFSFNSAGTRIGSKASSSITSSTSNVTITSNTFTPSATSINTTGQLSILSFGTIFTSAITYPSANLTLGNTLSALTIGKTTNTANITIGSTTAVAGPIAAFGGTIAINGALTATNSDIMLGATTAVTQTQPLTANGLSLNGTGTFTLTNTSNNIATLAGGAAGSLIGTTQVIDSSGGLTIGTLGSTSGLTGSSTIRVETLADNLTLAGSISTTSTSTDAVILTAAKTTAIGVQTGGDILVSGSPTITMGAGAIAKLFSGYDVTSTGLTALAGGASNVRINYDDTSTTFTPALTANNKYAIYRSALGYGDLNIVSTGGDAEGTTWIHENGIIKTKSGTANVSNTDVQTKLNSGNLSIEANKVTFSANVTGTTSNSLSILSKTHIVNTNATTIITQGGNVLLASNVDDATDNETTANGYILFGSGLTITTNGGNITLGGGNVTGTDYALGTSAYPYEGIRIDGTLNFNSSGGNINMKGKSYAVNSGSSAWGVGFYVLTTGSINSGTGTVTLDGISQSTGSTYSSALFSNGALTITSANTTADAIQLIGKSTGNGGEAWGLEAESALSLLATGTGGGITVSSSQQNSANNYDIVIRGEANILAKSGPINLLGGQSGGIANGTMLLGSTGYFGSKASSTVPTSSSTITIQYDKYNFSGYPPKLATSGTLNWKPVSASFGQNVQTDWFAWNQNSETLSGLTIGKSGNAVNVYLNNAITVAGPVNVYGAIIEFTGALTASGSDVSLYASAAVTQNQPIISSGLSLNGTGTFTLTNITNNFTTLAGGATGSLLGTTQIVDVSGGLTIGTNGTNSGLNGSSTIKVETLAGNLTLASSISTTSTSTDAVILTAAKSTAIGVGTGGDIILSGTPTITMGTGGIAKLFSGLESTSTGLTTLAGGSSNVRNNYDETTSTFLPVLSANNKYAIYRTSAGVGDLTILSTGGDTINSTWTYENGVINTKTSPVNILSSVIENYLASGPLTINAGNTTISSAITSTSSNALVFNANSTLSNTTPTTTVNAAITNAGSITINTGTFNVAQNITTTSTAAITISATNQISTSTTTRRTISTQGGNITLNADNDANGSGWLDIDDLTLNPGTGNLIVRGETFNINGTESRKPYINGTGSFTFESNDLSFGQDIATSWFVMDQDANGISGFTFGKSGTTVNVYLNTALTVAGPISVYGNYVEFTGNITSSANGDIFIKSLGNGNNPSVAIGSGKTINKSAGTGTLTFQANGRVTNNGTLSATGTGLLNLVMWSDYDNTNNDGGVSQFGTISTNGGHVWMGGSNSASGSYTWNGLTVGDGPSIGTFGYNCNALDLFGPITTGGGDVLLWASTPGCGTSSIAAETTRLINAGSGDITFIAPNTSGAIELTSTGVISLVPHAGSYASALTFGGTETSGNFSFNTSHYNGMKINSIANVGGLTIGKYDGMLSSGTPVVLGNTSNVSLSTNTNIGGPITVYGGTIALEANLTTTNNGDISLYTDNALGGLTTTARTITAAGSFNYIPRSDFFSVPVTYPITNLNLVSKGLLIGKPTNTANITFANATTVTGPITAYGGTITLNADLTTTNSSNFGTISLYSDNPLGGLTTARTLNAAGAFKYIPRTTAFTADVTYPIANLTSTSAGLTIGKTTNDKNITITQDVTGPFGIELYGNNVNINSNLTTTGINAIMYLKGNTTIAAGKYITSGGNFTHDGNMTFKSTATGTAAFGTLGGTFTTVSGNSTVERYFPAKRVFRFVSSAVTTSSNIRTNWQENGGTAAGLGTHITGTGGAANGFDPTGTNSTSIYTFNNTSAAWVPVANTTINTLTAGTPYRVNIRGDRTLDLSTNTPSPTVTTLRATGALATGPINAGTLSSSAYAYNFIGNPYQAPVNMKNALDAATNLNNVVYYVWDPRMNTRGAYISVDLTSTNGTPNNGSSGANKYLQPGQACFVRTGATAGSASLTFQESYKVVSSPNNTVFRADTQNTSALSTIKLRLFDSNSLALNLNALDGLVVFFDDAFSSSVDQNDGGKFANPDEMLSTFNNGALISIEKRQHPTSADIIPLRASQYRVTDYTMVAEGTNLNGVPAYLHDQFLQTYTEIPQSGVVNYPFNVATTNTQTTASDRFRIVYTNPLLNTNNTEWMNFTMYPNPSKQGNFNIILPQQINNGKVTIYTTLGKEIYTQNIDAALQTTITPKQQLATGIYYVVLEFESNKSVKKLIIE